MNSDDVEKKIIDSIRDTIPGSNLEFGWDGKKLYYRTFSGSHKVNWQEIKNLKFSPTRMVRIGKMLERNGIHA